MTAPTNAVAASMSSKVLPLFGVVGLAKPATPGQGLGGLRAIHQADAPLAGTMQGGA